LICGSLGCRPVATTSKSRVDCVHRLRPGASRPSMEIDSRRIRRLIRHHHARERKLDRVIREQAWLDRVAEPIQGAVGALYAGLGEPGRTLRSLMHGTKVLGHPLHPALTDIPVGAWTVAALAGWLWGATGRVPASGADPAPAAV